MLVLGFAQNSVFDLQGIDLNMDHSQNISAYSSLLQLILRTCACSFAYMLIAVVF